MRVEALILRSNRISWNHNCIWINSTTIPNTRSEAREFQSVPRLGSPVHGHSRGERRWKVAPWSIEAELWTGGMWGNVMFSQGGRRPANKNKPPCFYGGVWWWLHNGRFYLKKPNTEIMKLLLSVIFHAPRNHPSVHFVTGPAGHFSFTKLK